MLGDKRILGIIPARGGSKGLPRKNIKEFAGKPLIAWTIEEAHKSGYLDRVILSSDDAEIIKIAKKWRCEVPFIRPSRLAQDETPGIEPVIHAINTINEKYDYIVLLQPTSPLRTVDDIDGCIGFCAGKGEPACISVCPADKNPYWMHTLTGDGRLRPVLRAEKPAARRQDLPAVYTENGAVYVAKTDYLLREKRFITEETLAYIMPARRSLDIDNETDFLFGSLLIKENKGEHYGLSNKY